MKKDIPFILLYFIAFVASGQTKQGNIIINGHSNYLVDGKEVLVKTNRAHLDTLTNAFAGSYAYDTINDVIVQYNGTAWIDVIPESSNSLSGTNDQVDAALAEAIINDALQLNRTVMVNGIFCAIDSATDGTGQYIFLGNDQLNFGSGDIFRGEKRLSVGIEDDQFEIRLGFPNSVFSILDSVRNPNFAVTSNGKTTINGALTITEGNEGIGKVLTSDARGNVTWQSTVAYGEMAFGDSYYTLPLNKDATTWVTNATNNLMSQGAVELDNVTYANDRLIIKVDGVYTTSAHVTVTGVMGSVLKLMVLKNGTELSSDGPQVELQSNGMVNLSITPQIDRLAAGDVITLGIVNKADGNDIQMITGRVALMRIK
jgi:hypothetical protein